IGMRGLVAKRKGDFIGRRSLALAYGSSTEREQVVGLCAVEGTLEVGGRVLANGSSAPPCPTVGYVTSACFSPSAGRSIALALLERGQDRLGEVVTVYCSGVQVKATVCNPAFYDPDNKRLQA
ncbi:MAG: glycine cleavage T C-terminal barrel domain-containing protein, partial [Burkholderiaceae bacterium]|nr:glycine cleavage T C-terminal barrel domain-containing protein [Burkholderiaceae bacterium]